MSAPEKRTAGDRPAWDERAEDGIGWCIDSSHLPPPATAPWIERRAPVWGFDTADIADDRPEDLRLRPVAEIASALYRLADHGLTAPDRRVREAAAVLRRWLLEDQGERLDLATALGLRGSGRSFREAAARAEVRSILARLASGPRYRSLSPRAAAMAIRGDFDQWIGTAWPRLRDRRTPPPIPDPGLAFWRIASTGLAKPVPHVDVVAVMIDQARRRGG